ncbi:MAG: hypothetical protein IPK85_01965 [Gemmatimonadetes bacterium]|nr:hypothetical protein [Gemmatimonadota bacterium]
MRLTIHASVPPEWWEQCARVAARFDREHPAPHRDCIYGMRDPSPGDLSFYVTRTKAGGMAIRAWQDKPTKEPTP